MTSKQDSFTSLLKALDSFESVSLERITLFFPDFISGQGSNLHIFICKCGMLQLWRLHNTVRKRNNLTTSVTLLDKLCETGIIDI